MVSTKNSIDCNSLQGGGGRQGRLPLLSSQQILINLPTTKLFKTDPSYTNSPAKR